MSQSGYSTFEFPIRKLLKYLLTAALVGSAITFVLIALICNTTQILKPGFTDILLNGFVTFHANNLLLIPIYIFSGSMLALIVYMDRKNQKHKRQLRWKKIGEDLQRVGGD